MRSDCFCHLVNLNGDIDNIQSSSSLYFRATGLKCFYVGDRWLLKKKELIEKYILVVVCEYLINIIYI